MGRTDKLFVKKLLPNLTSDPIDDIIAPDAISKAINDIALFIKNGLTEYRDAVR